MFSVVGIHLDLSTNLILYANYFHILHIIHIFLLFKLYFLLETLAVGSLVVNFIFVGNYLINKMLLVKKHFYFTSCSRHRNLVYQLYAFQPFLLFLYFLTSFISKENGASVHINLLMVS